MNPKIDAYLNNRGKKWREEVTKLRDILLDCDLTEELKWGSPCYTFQDSNIVIIGAFREYCSLTFCKGSLLKDSQGILDKPGKNTQAARLIRFTQSSEITRMKSVLKTYIQEAIEVQKAGLKVNFKKISEFKIPKELQQQLDQNPIFKTAYHALTPGRQRGYLLYFSSAKQAKTREARVEKCMPRILKGKGLQD